MKEWNEAVETVVNEQADITTPEAREALRMSILLYLSVPYKKQVERALKVEKMLDEAIETLAINGIYPMGMVPRGRKAINKMWRIELTCRLEEK